MSDDPPDRRREPIDQRVRGLFAFGGYEVTSGTSWERFRENMEWVRHRFSKREEIGERDEFVTRLMDVESRRTKRHTQIIIWSIGVVTTAFATAESGLVQMVISHLVPTK